MAPTRLFLTVMLTSITFLAGCSYSPPAGGPVQFRSRAQTLADGDVRVTAAALTPAESRRVFAARMAENDIQPIWLQIDNGSPDELALDLVALDPDYYSASEAALKTRRFGEKGEHDKVRYFMEHHVPRRIPPAATVEGYVYTTVDPGAKAFTVRLVGASAPEPFEFVQTVPGFQTGFQRVTIDDLYRPGEIRRVDLDGLREYLETMPPCVKGGDKETDGDPLNLVIVGDGALMLTAFVRRGWDLTEDVTATSAWRTLVSSATGTEYRTSPISPLYLYGRAQDVAFQKIRSNVDQRNHLRLWRAPVTLHEMPVWVGQISRDVDVKLSSVTGVTHEINSWVDEARANVKRDLVASGHVARVGYVSGVGSSTPEAPRMNYTKDEYFTDGLRVVIMLETDRVEGRQVEPLTWEPVPAID